MVKRSKDNTAVADAPEISAESRKTWAFIERLLGSTLIRTMYLWGKPGIGKTYAAYHKGRLGNGLYAITLTEDTPAAELRGHFVPKGDEMVWMDGPFVKAMREGARLVVNELSHGAPEAHALLYPVLESKETARLTLPTGETVVPAEGFHCVCSDNSPPDDLPEALADRFDSTLEIEEPHPDAMAILRPQLRHAAMRSFVLEPERRIGLRSWLTVERLLAEFSLEEACHAVFGMKRGVQVYDAIVLARVHE